MRTGRAAPGSLESDTDSRRDEPGGCRGDLGDGKTGLAPYRRGGSRASSVKCPRRPACAVEGGAGRRGRGPARRPARRPHLLRAGAAQGPAYSPPGKRSAPVVPLESPAGGHRFHEEHLRANPSPGGGYAGMSAGRRPDRRGRAARDGRPRSGGEPGSGASRAPPVGAMYRRPRSAP